jgi:integrase
VYLGPDPITKKPRQVERTVRGTKSAAEAERRRLEREVSEGKHLGVKGTVGDLLEAWLAHVERIGRRPATVETYRTVIQAHLLPALGALRLRKLTAYDLGACYASKAQVGGSARQKTTGLGPNTIRQHHALVSSALAQAVRWGWIDKNPAAAASPPGKKKSGRKAPEPTEIRALIEACGDDVDLATAVSTGAITGARRGGCVDCGGMTSIGRRPGSVRAATSSREGWRPDQAAQGPRRR